MSPARDRQEVRVEVDGRTLTISDHYGVLAELWTPALDAAATLTPAHAAADVRRLHPDAVAV